MKEIWKNIPNYKYFYKASNLGRIKSCERILIFKNGAKYHKKEKIMKLRYDKRTGYLDV